MGLRGLRSYVVICDEIEDVAVNWEVRYEQGHPAGWTDDLGIMADRNQWVSEHLDGWYARRYDKSGWWESSRHRTDLVEWCEKNLTGYWEIPSDGYLYMASEEDVMLFKMRWM
jgi:hypothetical protein